ncbi:NAD(P)H-dependent oxidoreductase [Paraflavisolibacter sp. H34]|uniref:NADPH-dependent FMN reductase n=1 Tax=Huijunlia imazamoxiresistens TaxID=3127457 RepID=UPI00301856DD
MKIEILSGSPRTSSLTHRVAVSLQQMLQQRTEHEIGLIDLKQHILPPMEAVFASPDETPAKYRPLADRIFGASAFILVTPEYNGSYSPALKNLLDHFPKQQHKVFGIVTASPGALGGMRAALQLQQLVFALFGIGSPHMLIIPFVDKKFDKNGALCDASFQKSIDLFLEEFLWLAEKIADEKVPA